LPAKQTRSSRRTLTCGASSSSPSDSQFPPHRRTSEHRQQLKDADPRVSQEEAPFRTGTAVATAGGGNFPPIKESGHMYEEESELYPKRVLSLHSLSLSLPLLQWNLKGKASNKRTHFLGCKNYSSAPCTVC